MCFCKSKGNYASIFFVDEGGETHFRNKSIRSIYGKRLIAPVTKIAGEYFLHVTDTHSCVSPTEVKALFGDGAFHKKSVLHFVMPHDGFLNRNALETICEFTKLCDNVVIRYHQHVIQALCDMHSNIKIKMPQDKGKCTLHVGMHILNGGKNPLVPETCTGTFTISNTQVDIFQTRIEAMKGPKHRIDAFLHVPEPKLLCQYFLEGVLVQTAK
jgi:hypothetical protein